MDLSLTDALLAPLEQAFGDAQQWLFETLVQPALYGLGAANYLSDAYNGTGWLLVGLLQLLVMLLLIVPAERLWPMEPASVGVAARRERAHAVRMDVLYTVIHRLGLVRVVLFLGSDPLWQALFGWLAVQGVDGWHLDQAIAPWWPGVTDTALVGFLAYLVVFDFANYWIHRGQHHFDAWWALHAVHHSQRHMTLWTDSRNHLLDDLIVDILFVLLARAIGVAPGQFVALVALSQLVENLSHANLRWRWTGLWQRLVVGPHFHRVHHEIGVGHESGAPGTLGGHNFAVLFPVWDQLFGTAAFDRTPGATGIRDQLPAEGGRDYGRGFWAQQRLGLLRLIGRA